MRRPSRDGHGGGCIVTAVFPSDDCVVCGGMTRAFIRSVRTVNVRGFGSLGLSTTGIPIISRCTSDGCTFTRRMASSNCCVVAGVSAFRGMGVLFCTVGRFRLSFGVTMVPLSRCRSRSLSFDPCVIGRSFIPGASSGELGVEVSFSSNAFVRRGRISAALMGTMRLTKTSEILKLGLEVNGEFFVLGRLSRRRRGVAGFGGISRGL